MKAKEKTQKSNKLNGAIVEKKLTPKQKKFIELFKSVQGLFKEEFEKGIIKHPVR